MVSWVELRPQWVDERRWRSFWFKMANWGRAECPACGKLVSRSMLERHCRARGDEKHMELLAVWRQLRR